MTGKQLQLFSDEEMGVPIPECDPITLKIYGTPEKVARLTVEAARKWKQQRPDKDVFELIPPSWREYVKANL